MNEWAKHKIIKKKSYEMQVFGFYTWLPMIIFWHIYLYFNVYIINVVFKKKKKRDTRCYSVVERINVINNKDNLFFQEQLQFRARDAIASQQPCQSALDHVKHTTNVFV